MKICDGIRDAQDDCKLSGQKALASLTVALQAFQRASRHETRKPSSRTTDLHQLHPRPGAILKLSENFGDREARGPRVGCL